MPRVLRVPKVESEVTLILVDIDSPSTLGTLNTFLQNNFTNFPLHKHKHKSDKPQKI